MKYFFAGLLSLLIASAGAQSVEKKVFDPSDTTSGYYLFVKPQSGKIQGVLVLFPGFAEPAEAVFPETKLHNVGYINDVLTIAIGNGPIIYTNEKAISRLDQALTHVTKEFNVDPSRFLIGGFSAGGTVALRYTELCYENPSAHPIRPAGVFTVDSPVDIVDLYHYFERELARNFSQPGMNEARFIMDMMHKDLGDFKTSRDNYIAHSPFHYGTQNGHERFLKTVPTRVYHDIDVEWKLKNRRRSMHDANELQASELIARLMLMGNEHAEFKTGKTGYRSSGMRHPHSWSIVDEVELIQWMKKTLEFFPEFAPEPYAFMTPTDFFGEKEQFPLSFARDINLRGIADIRFMPGFYDDKNTQFWSYCFLWYLEGKIGFDDKSIQQHLEKYYTGLTGAQSHASVKKVKAQPAYEQSFQFSIETVDPFVTKKPIRLNGKVNIKPCPDGKTIAFFELSPTAYGSETWKALDAVSTTVGCEK